MKQIFNVNGSSRIQWHLITHLCLQLYLYIHTVHPFMWISTSLCNFSLQGGWLKLIFFWQIWPRSPWYPQVIQSVLFHFVPLVCNKRLHRCSPVFYGALRSLGGNSSVESANLRLVGAFNRSWKSILWHQLRRSVESPLFLCFLVDWRPPNKRRGRLASSFFLFFFTGCSIENKLVMWM